MPRKATRSAHGAGSVRQRPDGKWEARYTVGRNEGTGKPIRKSLYGNTQKEVRQRLTQALTSIDNGTYMEPAKITVGVWLDTWAEEYLVDIKPLTVTSYKNQIRLHLKPALGAVKLESLTTPTIQKFYNHLIVSKEDGGSGLSPKSIKNIHGVFHGALQQAVEIGYLRFNPSAACKLPRVQKKEIEPLDEVQSRAFLEAVQGCKFETLFTITLFTGIRQGEVMGLTWDCIDFGRGTIRIEKQLQQEKKKGGIYYFAPLKNDKVRIIAPAPWVLKLLRLHRVQQTEQRLKLGAIWEDSNLVFTNEIGEHLAFSTVRKEFKGIASAIGSPNLRFHDLRHSYAVASIRSGDDIKTVQGNLGHAAAAFTLDVYGHVTDQMKQASSERMESYIKDVLNL